MIVERRILDSDQILECPLLANNGLPGHVAGRSALPPTADIRVPKSVIVPISSALPLKADVAVVGRESPKLNIPLEFGREKLK